jgi:hypothetical protein
VTPVKYSGAVRKWHRLDEKLVAQTSHDPAYDPFVTSSAASARELPITRIIFELRGQRVILDRDLAAIYGAATKRFNEQVKRNVARFPEDFMFRVTPEERDHLRSQFATSKSQRADSRGGARYLPLAFTEHGAIQAANVLNSVRAVGMKRLPAFLPRSAT